MALVKKPKQLKLIEKAGQKLAEVFEYITPKVKAGTSTLEIESLVKEKIIKLGCKPSFYKYEGYPYASCISVNEQVIHAFPSTYVLKKGDIITIDVGLWYERACSDAARTFIIEPATKQLKMLKKATDEALEAGIAQAKAGNRVGAISAAIQAVAERYNLGIVRSYTGHGVGLAVHEEPAIPNIGVKSDGPILKPGMVLAIEPMFTLGSGDVSTQSDGWTVVTADSSMAAQSEDTVIITEQEPKIVTRLLQNNS